MTQHPIKKWLTQSHRKRFEAFVEPALNDLYRMAYALCGQHADAEDLTHEACLRAYAGFGKARVETPGEFRAWMRTILLNVYRDQYRRKQRSPLVQDDATLTYLYERTAAPVPSIEETLDHQTMTDRVVAALAELPSDLREVAVMRFMGDAAYKEIAERCECPVGTVMSRLSRARQLIRTALGMPKPKRRDCV